MTLAVSATPAAAAPPAGLTAYGRVIWNVDALLHDTFGQRQAYQDYLGKSVYPDFSTHFISEASSIPWAVTLATARHSQFRAVHPVVAPKVGDYVTGSNVPVKIGSAFISCGNGRWLYQRNGYPLGATIWCSRTP